MEAYQHCCRLLLEALCDVGQSNGEGLDSGERVLEVQCVCVVVDATKLHYLLEAKKVFKKWFPLFSNFLKNHVLCLT